MKILSKLVIGSLCIVAFLLVPRGLKRKARSPLSLLLDFEAGTIKLELDNVTINGATIVTLNPGKGQFWLDGKKMEFMATDLTVDVPWISYEHQGEIRHQYSPPAPGTLTKCLTLQGQLNGYDVTALTNTIREDVWANSPLTCDLRRIEFSCETADSSKNICWTLLDHIPSFGFYAFEQPLTSGDDEETDIGTCKKLAAWTILKASAVLYRKGDSYWLKLTGDSSQDLEVASAVAQKALSLVAGVRIDRRAQMIEQIGGTKIRLSGRTIGPQPVPVLIGPQPLCAAKPELVEDFLTDCSNYFLNHPNSKIFDALKTFWSTDGNFAQAREGSLGAAIETVALEVIKEHENDETVMAQQYRSDRDTFVKIRTGIDEFMQLNKESLAAVIFGEQLDDETREDFNKMISRFNLGGRKYSGTDHAIKHAANLLNIPISKVDLEPYTLRHKAAHGDSQQEYDQDRLDNLILCLRLAYMLALGQMGWSVNVTYDFVRIRKIDKSQATSS